uniref:C-type lectin domain-containing protein n=1 Tax=Oryzias latipes TaxID=8090 RepID=A0A3B3HGP7_ORYLA
MFAVTFFFFCLFVCFISVVCLPDSNTSERFYFIKDRMTCLNWTDAQSFCRDRHTDLISGPEQMEKLDVVKTDALVLKSEGGFVFIGLFRDAWQWNDGSSFSFRFWNLQYDDEKNNSSCAMMNEGGRWSSENCSVEHPFICYDGKRSLKFQDTSLTYIFFTFQKESAIR